MRKINRIFHSVLSPVQMSREHFGIKSMPDWGRTCNDSLPYDCFLASLDRSVETIEKVGGSFWYRNYRGKHPLPLLSFSPPSFFLRRALFELPFDAHVGIIINRLLLCTVYGKNSFPKMPILPSNDENMFISKRKDS